MAVRTGLGWLCLAAMVSMGCSSEVAPTANGGLDGQLANPTNPMTGSTTTGGTASSASTDACSTSTSWKAHNDLSFDASSGSRAFADTVNALIQASPSSPIAVSNHIDAHCVWTVAFSATEEVGASTAHSATFTKMLRHPVGLWTAAPQSLGWIRIVDTDAHVVWVPINDVTGSATYGGSACTSLSSARASATIPSSAGSLSLATPTGSTTLGALLGPESASGGWQVRFTFSADLAE
jgi:hypothetical protein